MTISDKIREAREARGLLQREVTERLREAGFGSVQSEVSGWERGKKGKMFLQNLRMGLAVARVLEVPLGWLADESDDRPVADATEGVPITGMERQILLAAREIGIPRTLELLGELLPLGPVQFHPGGAVAAGRSARGKGRRKA